MIITTILLYFVTNMMCIPRVKILFIW